MNDLIARPLLTVAIPTFNRAECLERSLRNIMEEVDRASKLAMKVEVVVVDNASEDNTAEIVQMYRARCNYIRYFRNQTNLGIDRNIYESVKRSSGEFVHLHSDDDVYAKGALPKIVDHIERNPNVHFTLLNYRTYSPETGVMHPNLLSIKEDKLFTDPNSFLECVHVHLTFISAFLFRRQSWLTACAHEEHMGTEIYLSYAALGVVASAPCAMAIAETTILRRAYYDGESYRMFRVFPREWRSFLLCYAIERGLAPRRMERLYREFLLRDLFMRIVGFRLSGKRIETKEFYDCIVRPTSEYAVSWLFIYPIVLVPLPALSLAKHVWLIYKSVRSKLMQLRSAT